MMQVVPNLPIGGFLKGNDTVTLPHKTGLACTIHDVFEAPSVAQYIDLLLPMNTALEVLETEPLYGNAGAQTWHGCRKPGLL